MVLKPSGNCDSSRALISSTRSLGLFVFGRIGKSK